MKKRSEIKEKIKNLFGDKYFYIGLLLLAAGIISNLVSSYYLYRKFRNTLPTLPIVHDIILDKIPYIPMRFVYNSLGIISVLLFLVYLYKKKFEKIPYSFILIGAYLILRAVFIILTPLGTPNGGTKGVYPSGHTGVMFLLFLLSSGNYKKIFLVVTLAMVVALLLGRGHYTVDIFSAIIFSYAVYVTGEEYFKKRIMKRR